jgi:hypothetical protein
MGNCQFRVEVKIATLTWQRAARFGMGRLEGKGEVKIPTSPNGREKWGTLVLQWPARCGPG